MSTIKGHVNELNELIEALKMHNLKGKELRSKITDVKNQIDIYLDETSQIGFKHNGTIITRQIVEKKERKQPAKKIIDSIEILRKAGVREPETVLKELKETQFGEITEKQKLRVEKVREKKR